MNEVTPLDEMNGPYDLILADPPWKFASNSKKKPGKNAMSHYDCMPLDDIKGLPVADVASKDALLLLWTTVPFALLAIPVFEAWGFQYKSQMTWAKDKIGTGFWARNRHEILYICKRGKFPCPKPAPFPDSVMTGQQREHSRKPDALHEMIAACPDWKDLNKLEMFAREPRDGWDAWGNETTKFAEPTADSEIEDMLS